MMPLHASLRQKKASSHVRTFRGKSVENSFFGSRKPCYSLEMAGNLCCLTYDVVNQLLAYLYLTVFSVAAMLTMRLRQASWWPPSWQKIFHSIILVGSFVRFLFFALQPWIREDEFTMSNSVNIVLNSFPSVLFFTTYLLLLFFWAELMRVSHSPAHQANARPSTVGTRPYYLTLATITLAIAVVLYIIDNAMYGDRTSNISHISTPVEHVIWFYLVFLAFLTVMGFVYFGFRMIRMVLFMGHSSSDTMIPWKSLSQPRRTILIKVAVISTVCTITFLCRAIADTMATISTFSGLFARSWWINLGYFLVLEVLPLILILYVLRLSSKTKNKGGDPEEKRSFVS